MEQALVMLGASGAALLYRGEEFDPEDVAILRQGAIIPGDVSWAEDEVAMSLRILTG